MDDLSIIPECYVDTNLIETLVPPATQYNHQKGCGTVAKVMKGKFSNRFAVGIIDKDKKDIKYLEEFDTICNKGSLILHKHTTRPHYIIQIAPAMELFILNTASGCGILLEDFDLPSDLTLFRKESKTVNSKKDQRFKGLFKSLVLNGSPEIIRLKTWITYLKDKNYQADIRELERL